ncbi:MAG: hypothetical protein Q9170_000564 [Blastenia crenularia]
MVMFAFEFAVLTVLSLSTTARYSLSLYQTAVIKRQLARGRERLRQREGNLLSEEEINNTEVDTAGWEEKGLWVFYLDIATDFFKLVLYLTFFCVLCTFYGMPIHIIRDVALTIRSFYRRIRDFVQYKHATRDMNARYPDATAEEISREDVCIICRENMTAWQDSATHQEERGPIDERQRAKKLPCGHLLHFACLRSWLERQQICPTCRTPVLSNSPEPPNPNQTAGQAVQGQTRPINPPVRGPHIYTLGPFRLVFGARHVNNNPQPNSLAAGPIGNPTDATLSRSPVTSNAAGIQAQLDQIEQQITQEISNLNNMSAQLQLIRALQSELARLRISQGFQGNLAARSTYQHGQTSHWLPQQTTQAYRQVPLARGTQDFPAGLTIPDDWTLHALQRISGSVNVNTQPGQRHPQQAQRMTAGYEQGSGSANLRSSSSPAPVSGTEYSISSAAAQDHGAPAEERHHQSEHSEPSTAEADESLASLPRWGSTTVYGRGSDERSIEESSRMESSQRKGKGRAVTVEDDVDGVDGMDD